MLLAELGELESPVKQQPRSWMNENGTYKHQPARLGSVCQGGG